MFSISLAKIFSTIASILGLLSWLYHANSVVNIVVNTMKYPAGSVVSLCLYGVRFV